MFARLRGHPRTQAQKAAKVLNEQPAVVATEEMRLLISTVEDLIESLATAADPELRRLRTQTEAAVSTAKSAIAEGGARIREQARDLADQGEAYARAHPWTSFGFVALSALAVGLWTGRAMVAAFDDVADR